MEEWSGGKRAFLTEQGPVQRKIQSLGCLVLSGMEQKMGHKREAGI